MPVPRRPGLGAVKANEPMDVTDRTATTPPTGNVPIFRFGPYAGSMVPKGPPNWSGTAQAPPVARSPGISDPGSDGFVLKVVTMSSRARRCRQLGPVDPNPPADPGNQP